MSDDQALIESFDAVIRRVWHDGRWFFSVVDVIRAITESPNPRNYWSMLKARLRDEGASETYTNCVQLRMPAPDGKLRLTDAADEETLLRIIQSIPSPKAEPIKQWLAQVGRERLEEMRDPALAADRLQQLLGGTRWLNSMPATSHQSSPTTTPRLPGALPGAT